MARHSRTRVRSWPRWVRRTRFARVTLAVLALTAVGIAAWQAGSSATSSGSSTPAPPIYLGVAASNVPTAAAASSSGGSASYSGFPDASTTGVPTGTTLTQVPAQATSGTGWRWDGNHTVVVTAPNTTITGLDINGSLTNTYPGVTIKNTRIRCTNENNWCLTLGGPNATVTDTDIGGGANGTTYMHGIGVLSGGTNLNNLIQRVNIHHTIHGARIDGGTTVTDSYIHDLPMGDPVYNNATGTYSTTDHTDGIMSTGGNGTLITHNRVECGNTSTMFVQWESDQPQISSFTIQNNLFVNISKNNQVSSQGVAFEDKGIANPAGITIKNNTFTPGWQVAAIEAPTGSNVTGNVFTNTSPASHYWV